MHDNLDTVLKALSSGAPVQNVSCFGFVHDEPKGIKAIDQKGAGAGVKQTRLYIFPDNTTNTVHLIIVGDKKSQKADIKYATDFVDNLGAQKGETNGE